MKHAYLILVPVLLLFACGDDGTLEPGEDGGRPPREDGGRPPGEDGAMPPPGTDGGTPGTDGSLPGTDAGLPPDPACALRAAFDEGVTYERTLYVAAGSSGNGSEGSPFGSIEEAAAAATPGTRILVAAGSYAPFRADGLRGTESAPIAIVADGAAVIDGGGAAVVGISMTDPEYVVIEGFTIRNVGIHGMNIDDGGSYDTPGHHLVLRGITIPGAGSGGNNDCIKMSGIDDFWVLDSDVAGCNRGEIIDMVGCHRGVIHGNHFHDPVQNGVQTKGGSSDTVIHGNVFEGVPARAVNAGGSTGLEYFRPIDATAEAANIRVLSNVFVGNGMEGGAAVAFVGCDGCTAAHNVVVDPRTWVVRILQETTDARFVPSRNGLFVNNIILLDSSRIRTTVNVGGGTAPETFTFGNNLWWATDDPGWGVPSHGSGIPEETGSISADPGFTDASSGDYRIGAGSPAVGAARALAFPLPHDFGGRCYADPAAIGAFEAP